MSVTINGLTLASLGLAARELSGWLDGPDRQRATVGIPNTLGVLSANVSTTPPRQIRLLANMNLTTLSSRATQLATLQDALSGLLTLRFDDTPGRVVHAIAGPITAASMAPSIGMTTGASSLVVAIPFLALDVASYDDNPRVIAVQTTPTEIALGTLPSPGVLQLSGAWTSATTRVITYRGVNGIAYGTMTLTAAVTLGADEYVELDLGRQYITKVGNTGTRADAYAWLTAGDWFVPEPADAYRGAPKWSTLEVSAGVCLFLYRKAWAL